MGKIDEISILGIQEMFNKRQISIRELVQEYLNRIALFDQGETKLNSILEINPEVLEIAEKLEEHRSEYTSNLYGIPILLKDNMDTEDRMHTSAGSLALAESFASSDCDIVKMLRSKGAIILGKTNMTEFANYMTKAMKAGYSSRGGQVVSPYNKQIDPHGSSTGAAVAVSANFCAASIGTDTSGSINSPAMRNGIVGFRPSIGALSQKGIIPVSFTLDTAGPMTRTVMDSAIIFSELKNLNLNITQIDFKGAVIGIDQGYFENLSSEEVKKANTSIKEIESAGAIIKRIKIPQIPTDNLKRIQRYEFKYGINKYLSMLPSGFSIRSLEDIIEFNKANEEKALKYGQTHFIDVEENTRGDLSETAYLNQLQDRQKMKKEFFELLKGIDVCLMFEQNLVLQYIGLPSITIPRGLYNDGTPMGIYLTACEDSKLLKLAYKIEQIIGHRVPPNSYIL